MQISRQGVQGLTRPGIRRVVSGLLSSAREPDNFLIVAAIVLAIVVLIAMAALTVREFIRLRREKKR